LQTIIHVKLLNTRTGSINRYLSPW